MHDAGWKVSSFVGTETRTRRKSFHLVFSSRVGRELFPCSLRILLLFAREMDELILMNQQVAHCR